MFTSHRREPRLGSRRSMVLGRGGMGSVYLATQVRLNRPVAIKVLPRALAADPELRERFLRETADEYARIRERHAGREAATVLLPIADARQRHAAIDWDVYTPPVPRRAGVTFDDYPLDELVPYIDWTPFFRTWELAGAYPGILDDPTVGPQARDLLADATTLLERIVTGRLLRAQAVVGLYPANAVGDDVELYADESRGSVVATMRGLRQQFEKPPGRPNLCLADFVAPRESELLDYMGAFAVTAGHGLEALVAEFERAHDDYGAIMAKALADRLAEALAERGSERGKRFVLRCGGTTLSRRFAPTSPVEGLRHARK